MTNYILEQLGLTEKDMEECPKCKQMRKFPEPHGAMNAESREIKGWDICTSCGMDEAVALNKKVGALREEETEASHA